MKHFQLLPLYALCYILIDWLLLVYSKFLCLVYKTDMYHCALCGVAKTQWDKVPISHKDSLMNMLKFLFNVLVEPTICTTAQSSALFGCKGSSIRWCRLCFRSASLPMAEPASTDWSFHTDNWASFSLSLYNYSFKSYFNRTLALISNACSYKPQSHLFRIGAWSLIKMQERFPWSLFPPPSFLEYGGFLLYLSSPEPQQPHGAVKGFIHSENNSEWELRHGKGTIVEMAKKDQYCNPTNMSEQANKTSLNLLYTCQ